MTGPGISLDPVVRNQVCEHETQKTKTLFLHLHKKRIRGLALRDTNPARALAGHCATPQQSVVPLRL